MAFKQRTYSIIFLFFLSFVYVSAEEIPYPGKVISSGAYFSSSIFPGIGILSSGAEIEGGIQLQGPSIPGTARLGAGYGYRDNDGTGILLPKGSAAWGYGFSAGPVMVRPGIGIDVIWPLDEDFAPGPPTSFIFFETNAVFHMNKGRFFELFIKAGYGFDPLPGFSAGAGVRLYKAQQLKLPVLAPKGRISIEPETLFSPDGDGINDELTIHYDSSFKKNIKSVKMSIKDQYGRPFKTWETLPGKEGSIVWGGFSDVIDGAYEGVQSASDYTIELIVTDILERTKTTEVMFRVDVLVIKEGDIYKIRVPSIQFPPNSADFSLLTDEEDIKRNKEIIDRLAVIFSKFPDYRITIVGHANAESYDDAEKMALEQNEVLIPLSLSRAEMVRSMLVADGVSSDILQVAGYGAAQPVVPFSNEAERWKNRRVEFILEK